MSKKREIFSRTLVIIYIWVKRVCEPDSPTGQKRGWNGGMCKHGEGGGYFVLPGTPPRPGSGEKDKFCRFLCKNLNIFLDNSTGSSAKNVWNQEHMMGECVDFLFPFPSFLPPGQQKCEEKKRKKNVEDIFFSEIHKIRLNAYFCNKSLRNIRVNCHNSDPGTVFLWLSFMAGFCSGSEGLGGGN